MVDSNVNYVLDVTGYPCYAQKWVPELDTMDQAAKWHQHRAGRIPA